MNSPSHPPPFVPSPSHPLTPSPSHSQVTCRAIGIGAYLVRLGQRTIQVDNSHIILTGAGALNKVHTRTHTRTRNAHTRTHIHDTHLHAYTQPHARTHAHPHSHHHTRIIAHGHTHAPARINAHPLTHMTTDTHTTTHTHSLRQTQSHSSSSRGGCAVEWTAWCSTAVRRRGDQSNAPDRLIALDRHLLCTGLRWLSRRSSNTGHLEIEDRTANLKYNPMPRLEKS